MVPNKRRKIDEVKEAERQRREQICAAYENAFTDLPMPSRTQTRKRAGIAGQLQNQKKPTKLQLLKQEYEQLQKKTDQLEEFQR